MLDNFQLLGNLYLDVFKYLDKYFLSQSQVANVIELHHFQVARFLDEQWLEGKLDKDFKPHIFSIKRDSQGRGGRGEIKTVPIDLASEFWFNRALKGNVKAQALAQACLKETFRRRCDRKFGDVKSEDEYEQKAISDRQTWGDARSYCISEVKRNLSECFV